MTARKRRGAAAQARRVIDAWCRGCAVIGACHAWAAAEPHFDGIAGGRLWRRRGEGA